MDLILSGMQQSYPLRQSHIFSSRCATCDIRHLNNGACGALRWYYWRYVYMKNPKHLELVCKGSARLHSDSRVTTRTHLVQSTETHKKSNQ